MMIYLIAYLAFVALFGVPTKGQEAININVPVVEVPVEFVGEPMIMDEAIVEVPDDEDIDVARMFGDLLEFNYEDVDEEQESKREERNVQDLGIGETLQPVNDPEIILKYNNFIDAFFNRLSNSMRLNHDPMRLVILQSGKIDADETPQKNNGNKNKSGKRNNAAKNDRKNTNRHPKDISIKDEQNSAENEAKLRARRAVLAKANENENLEKNLEGNNDEFYDEDEEYFEDNELEGRALDEEYDLLYDEYYDDEEYEDEEDLKEVESTREGRELSPKAEEERNPDGRNTDEVEVEGRQRRRGTRRRRKGGRGRRRRKCGKFCQRRKRRLRRRRLRNRRRGKRSIESPTAVISGISNMKRVGNVRISEGRESQDIAAEFDIGPIILKAQRSYGKGSKVAIREAQATTSSVRGEVIVNVNRDGTAKVKKLQLLRPESIQVTGTLRKKENLSSDKAMQGFVRRTRPVVARKMRQAAAKIFRLTRKTENNKVNNN